MKRRVLSILTALALCMGLLPAGSLSALAAEGSGGSKDAFGIPMEDKTESNMANNPYGTEHWFTLNRVSELSVANCDNGGGWIRNYDFNPGGTPGSIGAIFSSATNKEPANSKELNYAVMDTAASDPTGCGQQDHTAVLAYEKDHNQVVFYLLDKNGNRVGNSVYIGDDKSTYFMEQTRGYGSNGFLAVASGDFNGDGVETLIIYVPMMRASDKDPILQEYALENGRLVMKRNVVGSVWTMLGIEDISTVAGDNHGKTRQNAPVMQLLAEDTDRDGVDELIVTASMNDCSTNKVAGEKRASHLYIFDRHGNVWEKTHESYFDNYSSTAIRDAKYIRWATSGVGNIMSGNGAVDYPEIVTAGWVSKKNHDKTHGIGSYITSCTGTARGTDGVAVGTYMTTQVTQTITGGGSEFTKGGHYCNDAVPGLFQVEVFYGNGAANPATVLLSDTVYTYQEAGSGSGGSQWKYLFRDGYFNDDDDGMGGVAITNGVILDAVSGNFDGNTDGREQVVFASLQKESGRDKYFIRLYTYQYKKVQIPGAPGSTGTGQTIEGWSCDKSVYLSDRAEWGILSLTAPDIDQDSTIAKIKNITYTYTEPSALAILEAAPYFSELGEQGGETGYGKTTGSGTGATQSNGLSASVSTGFEWGMDDVCAGFGCSVGFEVSVENSFSWETETSTSVAYSLEYTNDTEENQVIVYRRPVWAYEYEIKDHPDVSMTQVRYGTLATNMISVDEYNELAGYYDLDPIADGVLADGGDPFSYRSSTSGLNNVAAAADTANYQGTGSVSQSLSYSSETQNTFNYELECSVEVSGSAFGVTAGAGAGYTHGEGAYTVNSSEISKSGSVACNDTPGYNFQWKFVHWTIPLNHVEVPVLGYVVTNVTAPPTPPTDLSAEDVTATSATIKWKHGGRPADAYYIYQYFPDTNRYIQIDEVDGTQDSCAITNLTPNTSYHYVIRAYTAQPGGGTDQSVYSEDLGLTTHPEGAQPVTISELKDATAKPGGEAVFTISATLPSTSDYTTVNFQWQKRNAGGTWEDVSGATASSLTISNVTQDMGGSVYRCCVTALFKGSPITYYSNSAELKVGRDQAAATLIVTGAAGGSGTLPAPYTGKADYQKQTGTTETQVTTKEPVTVEKDGTACPVYSITSGGTEHYYTVIVTSSGNDTNTRYYQVSKSGDTYTLGSEISLSTTTAYQGKDGGAYTPPSGFDPDSRVRDTSNAYTLMAKAEGTGATEEDTRITGVTGVTYYWQSKGEYYTYGENGAVGAKIEIPSEDEGSTAADNPYNEPLYDVISKSDADAVLGRDETYGEQSGYWYYDLKTGKTVTPFQAVRTDSYNADGTPDTVFDPTQLSVVTQEKTETVQTPVYAPENGTVLTFSSTVTAGGRTVSGVTVNFQITNQQTRATTTVSAVTNGSGVATVSTWHAPASGLYSIQAVAQPTDDTTSAASGAQYYDAQASAAKEYRVVFQKDGAITGSVPFGSSVTFGLQSREQTNGTWSAWSAATDGVTYKVTAPGGKASAVTSPYNPVSAGNYTFQAVDAKGIQLAAATLEVTRVAVTITPVFTGTPGSAEDVTLKAEGADLTDAELKTVFAVNCPYFGNTGASGRFTVSLSYKTGSAAAAVNAFKNNYIVTLKSDSFLIRPNSAQVNFSSGENGNILGRYGEGQYTMPESSSRTNGQKLIFQATPKEGFLVDQWIINGTAYAAGATLPAGMELSADRLTLTIPAFDVEKHTTASGSTKALTVKVTFRNDNYTITYSVNGSGGTLSATVSKGGSGEQAMGSGGSVMLGSTVKFTAAPEADYVIEKWTVDGRAYTREDGTTLYRGKTLTLDNVTASHTVQVSFVKVTAPLTVTANVVDQGGTVNTSLGTITTTDPDNGDQPIALSGLKAGQSITFTVAVANESNNSVQEWQVKKAGETAFTTIKGSGGRKSVSLYNLEQDTEVRVIIATAQRYTLNWTIEGEYPSGTALKASSNGAALTSGEAQNAFISVDFALTLNDAYYVESWSGAAQDSTDPKKAVLGSLTGDTTVTVTVKKKPVVTIGTATGGSVSVTGTVNGQKQSIGSGSYVDYGTSLTVTLSPDKGYKVGTISNQSPAYTDAGATGDTTDEMAYTIQSVTSDQTVTPVFAPLSTYQISYSVVDTNGAEAGGTNGTLAADVSRKGMAAYESEYDKTAATSGSTQVYEGGKITLTAEPEPGYHVKEWTIGGRVYEVNGASFVGRLVTLDEAKLSEYSQEGVVPAITVQFETGDPRITFTSPEHGTLTATVFGLPFVSGGSTSENVTFTVVPDAHYEVKEWKVDRVTVEGATGTTYTLAPGTKNSDVEVVLQGEVVAVTAEAGAGGAVTGLPDPVRYGDSITLTAVPDAGYTFEGWYLNGEKRSGETSYTFTAQTGDKYQAKFAPIVSIVTFSVNDSGMGTITAAANGKSFPSGTGLEGGQKLVFTVVPGDGCYVSAWSGLPEDAEISADKTTATVSALSGELTVTAILQIAPVYTITIDPSDGGSITARVNGEDVTEVKAGTVVTFHAEPKSYWTFQAWTGHAAGKTGTTFTMAVNENITVGAAFKALFRYGVRFSAGSGGSITGTANGSAMTPNVETQQAGNSDLVFTAIPNGGNMVSRWTVNGRPVDGNLSNTLTMQLTGPTTVTAEFEAYAGYKIPVSTDTYVIEDVRRVPSDTEPATQIRKNGTVTFTVKPAGGAGGAWSELAINGYDCLTGTGTTANCDSVTAVKNIDGSYTVTVTRVTGDITADIQARKVAIGDLDNYVPPKALQEQGITSVEAIKTRLVIQLTGTAATQAFYDIALKYYNSTTNSWVNVTPENFPKDGVDVLVPYPTGSNSGDTFTIVHMLTAPGRAGEVEKIEYTKTSGGLSFHVNSLSPFGVSWVSAHTVTFNSQGGSAVSSQTVTAGEKVTKPGDPTRNGYTFGGWYKESGCTSAWNFGTDTVTGNMTLYAKWTKADSGVISPDGPGGGGSGGGGGQPTAGTYTVSFDSRGGSAVKSQTIKAGKKAVKPGDPTRSGYTFSGWYQDSACTVQWDFATGAVTRDLTLYAKWQAKTCDGGKDCPSSKFKDVGKADTWYHEAVDFVLLNHLMDGYGNGLFGPGDNLTRAQFAQILYNKAGKPSVTGNSPFTDVASGAWYSDAVIWAASEGIVKGYGNGQFGPDDDITREQLAVMLWQYAGSPDATDKELHFSDAGEVSEWALDAMLWAVENGVISGYGDGRSDPQGPATRAQAAQMVKNFLEDKI